MCLTSSRLLKSLWTPGIGIQNHLFGQLPWIRSWRNCNGAGKPSKTSSRDAPCRVHEKGGKNNSSRLGDTTLAVPKFKDGDTLKTFDYVVANPPFSDKRWSTGIDPLHDPYDRFQSFGTPPAKQGDYAYLLHIVRSLKSTGKGACILPHGVLFRSNAEVDIRRALVRKGYIKGIIGIPPNLSYGTGIPARASS